MPKKPKDQSREEKKWVRKSAYLFLCDACNARSGINIADAELSVRDVDFGLQLGTGDGAMERATLHHCNSGDLWPTRFRVSDGWYIIVSFRDPLRWYIHSGSQMADTFVKVFRWMRPPFRVSDRCYLRWGFSAGWDLYLTFRWMEIQLGFSMHYIFI